MKNALKTGTVARYNIPDGAHVVIACPTRYAYEFYEVITIPTQRVQIAHEDDLTLEGVTLRPCRETVSKAVSLAYRDARARGFAHTLPGWIEGPTPAEYLGGEPWPHYDTTICMWCGREYIRHTGVWAYCSQEHADMDNYTYGWAMPWERVQEMLEDGSWAPYVAHRKLEEN